MQSLKKSPEHIFVEKENLRARYGRNRNWVDQYVQQAGFPGEIGNGLWRLDHILRF